MRNVMAVINLTEARIRDLPAGSGIYRDEQVKGLMVTQEQLAHDAEIDLTYLGGIERGRRNPSVAVVGRLADVLAVHPSRLFDG
jgi:transcriptional regulator with XRE-family HTH domain